LNRQIANQKIGNKNHKKEGKKETSNKERDIA
jgi:hypothetical protein